MRKNRLEKFETKIEPEITPQMHKANCERVAEMLLTVAEKVEPLPVSETYQDLLDQMKNGVKRSPVVVDHFDGRRIRYDSGNAEIITPEKFLASEPTLHNSSDAEKFLASEPTLYTADELRILESLKDAE